MNDTFIISFKIISFKNLICMKAIFISILLTFILTKVYTQNYRDTLYISPNNNDSSYQVIFIDTPRSNFHNKVFDFLLSDSSIYYENLKQIVKNKNYQKNRTILKYIGDWITIQKFKNSFYAYYPSEPYFNTFIKITDSVLVINDFNEGALIPYSISKVIQKRNRIIFKLTNSYNIKHTLSIQQKTNAIIEIKSSLFNVNKLRFIKRQSYFELPIIVNYCPNNKCQVFNFK